jgi:hypothetical protein
MKHRKILAAILLSLTMLFADQPAAASSSAAAALGNVKAAAKSYRTELYFGTDKPGGGKVSPQDWDKFLESEVTPRFPDGFTVLEGYGQYKGSDGKIVREASHILVIFYPKKQRVDVDRKVEELRDSYKKLFNQESVLRVDFLKSINVKF